MNIERFIKWLGIGIATIFAIVVVALAALEFFVSDAYVARIVTKYAQQMLAAELKVEKIGFTAFSHFPSVGIKLTDGSIVSTSHLKDSVQYARTPAQADTLASFKEFTLLFNPAKLLSGRVDIHGIILDSPRAYAYVSPTGCTNWDILLPPEDSLEVVPADTLDESIAFNINVRNIAVTNGGRFTYDNRADKMRASAYMNSVSLQGNFTDQLEKIRVRKGNFSRLNVALSASNTQQGRASMRFAIDTLNIAGTGKGILGIEAKTRTNVRLADNSMAENLPVDIKGEVLMGGRRENAVTFKDLKISLAKIPLVLNGKLSYCADSILTENLTARVEEFPLAEFLQYIPQSLVPDIRKLKTDTRLSVDARISGSYNLATGALPKADVRFNIPSSSLEFEGIKEKIEEISLGGDFHYRPDCADSTMVSIERMLVKGDGIALYGKGSAKDLERDPYLNLYMNSRIHLDSLVKMLPLQEEIYGTGSMAAELNIKSRLSNLTLYNLAKAEIKGSINAQKVEMGIPSRNIVCNLYGGEVKLGSNVNTKDTTIAKGTKMIGVFVKVDSTYMKYADTLQLAGNSILLSGRNEATLFDTTSKNVKPFKGTFTAKRLNLRGPDSISLRIAGTSNRFSILPYKGDISIPSIALSSTTDRIMARQGVHFLTLSKGEFNVNAHINDGELKLRNQRMAQLMDSLQIIYPQVERDSLIRHWITQRGVSRKGTYTPDDFAQDDYNFMLNDKGIIHLLNRWDGDGYMSAATIRVSTPAFPLRTRASGSKVSFNLNEVRVDESSILSGRSSFRTSGSIKGIKGALTRGSRLRMELNVDADTLNFNEIAQALSVGSEFLEKQGAAADSLMKAASEEDLEEMVAIEGADILTKMPLLIIPKNLEARLNLNVNYGVYSSIILNGAKGELVSKNRCLQISDFKATTSAGEMELDAFYRTKSKKDLNVGFDLQFKDMDMGKFIKLYPNIDSLLPMLKSFEGIINCQMAATSQIDTNMNFILPTVEGVARIKGDSLVLLDGETFAEIAKMMKFKNRQRNLVDSIAVEIAIKDGKIEVFPFIMKMDRYSTAISGVQDMDMNFNYHISVLKSPIPMRLGIDITGNMDDFKFKIGKAKYKDANLPVHTSFIDSTRLSLKEYIKKSLTTGM